jgi:hypothetical protein
MKSRKLTKDNHLPTKVGQHYPVYIEHFNKLYDDVASFLGEEATNIGLTALAGGGQSGATALVFGYNEVTTVTSAGDSVLLPEITDDCIGRIVTIKNDGSNALDVFPYTSEIINDLAVNIAIGVGAGAVVQFKAIDSTHWEADTESIIIHSTTAGKGWIRMAAANQAGDTELTITNASQAAARTYTIPDALAAANFVLDTAQDGKVTALHENLTIAEGYDVTITAEDAASSITLDEQSFEVEGEGTATRLFKLVNSADAAATLTVGGTSMKLTGGTNTFLLEAGTASLDVATAIDVDIDKNLTVNGDAGTTLTSEDVAGTITLDNCNLEIEDTTNAGNKIKIINTNDDTDKTITLNENLTVGAGNDGTITFTGASKILSVENTSVVNQDLTSDATVTFAGVNATTFDTNVAAAGVTLTGTTLAADGTNTDIPITVTPKGTGQILTGAGAVGTPIYSFTGDPNSGIYNVGANQVGVACDGALATLFDTTGVKTDRASDRTAVAGKYPTMSTKTVKYTVGVYGTTGVDHNFAIGTTDHSERSVQLGSTTIIPGLARVIDVVVVCTENLSTGAATATVDAGLTSGSAAGAAPVAGAAVAGVLTCVVVAPPWAGAAGLAAGAAPLAGLAAGAPAAGLAAGTAASSPPPPTVAFPA